MTLSIFTYAVTSRLSLKKFLSRNIPESRISRFDVSHIDVYSSHKPLVLLRLEKGTYICCSLLNQKELEMNALFAMFSEVLES